MFVIERTEAARCITRRMRGANWSIRARAIAIGARAPTSGPNAAQLLARRRKVTMHSSRAPGTTQRRHHSLEVFMSLFDSISRTLKGLLNDAADSVQDPSRDSRQIVRELDESIGKAENSLIEIQAQVATQQSKRDVAADKAKKYEDGAKRALQGGDEALAREALGAQATAEAERDALTKELATLEPSVAQLKSQIEDMRARRNDLNARSNILQAKQQIAEAKDVAATALGGIGGKNLSEDFQKLEDKVALSNARSDARLNSADVKSGKALDDKLADLNRGPSVEDRLEALKKQLNTPAQ
jgi:phage shock protein A